MCNYSQPFLQRLVFNNWWKKTLAGLALLLPTLATGGAIVAAIFAALQYLK